MGTKSNPGKFDCYENAAPDEPMFILLARDSSSPELVRAWAENRRFLIMSGDKPREDLPMVHEAMDCADRMIAWRERVKGLQDPLQKSAEDAMIRYELMSEEDKKKMWADHHMS